MPRHTRRIQQAESVVGILTDILRNHCQSNGLAILPRMSHLEIQDPCVVVILSREERVFEVSGVDVSKRVVMGVPAAEAEIKTADTCAVLVYDDDLFVVRPELDVVCIRTSANCPWSFSAGPLTFAANMVRVAHTSNVRVQCFEGVLGVGRAHRHRLRDLLVHDDIDLHALLGLALQHAVQSPFFVERRGATEVQLGREPPVLQ